MYCMHCGEQITDNSRYCKYCGRLVAEDEIINYNENEEESAAPVEEDESSFSYNYSEKTDFKEKEQVIDDLFFEHIPKKKKIALFFIAVFMTAIVAAIVFAVFFPELV